MEAALIIMGIGLVLIALNKLLTKERDFYLIERRSVRKDREDLCGRGEIDKTLFALDRKYLNKKENLQRYIHGTLYVALSDINSNKKDMDAHLMMRWKCDVFEEINAALEKFNQYKSEEHGYAGQITQYFVIAVSANSANDAASRWLTQKYLHDVREIARSALIQPYIGSVAA